MYRSHFPNDMTKDYDVVKEFAFLVVNIGKYEGHHNDLHMLVLKSDRESFYFDPEDKECLSN